MSATVISLLLSLNVAHFLGDFTPLNRWFITAKRYGKPWWLVAGHGTVNGTLFGLMAWIIAGGKAALIAFTIETVTHTLIDLLKGRINQWFPVVEDPAKAIHWTVMGADQMMHQMILIFIVFLCF
jgi:hypothetical protein